MTIDSTGERSPRAGVAAPGTRPVGPVPFVPIVMGPMTRKLNPVMGRFAGRENFHMAAQLKHIGRRSGKAYVTPVSARVIGDVALVPLTFGNQSDWAQNVRAAGGCAIRFEGLDYIATEPEFLTRQEVKPLLSSAFNPAQRVMLRVLGIKQFLRLQVSPVRD
jgi:deazaflavin-dependent oxidoreductase (nitroreductase family)